MSRRGGPRRFRVGDPGPEGGAFPVEALVGATRVPIPQGAEPESHDLAVAVGVAPYAHASARSVHGRPHALADARSTS